MSNKYFVEVPINGPEDLPKKSGRYNCINSDDKQLYMTFDKSETCQDYWLTLIKSYWQPAEPGVLYEKVSVEGCTVVSKEYVKKTDTNDMIYLRPIQ